MPKQVTYGVSGLIDWVATLPVGNARLRVHFTGGALTKYGVTPAEFTTTDPLTQRIIEDSAYFRSGRITILRSVGRPDVQPLSAKNDIEAQTAFAGATLPFDTPPAEQRVFDMPCLEDAIEYMREHYHIPTMRIRTPEMLKSVADQYGLTFNITS